MIRKSFLRIKIYRLIFLNKILSGLVILSLILTFIGFVHSQSITNLLSNGSFENDFTSWTNSGNTITTTDIHSGAKAVHSTGGNLSQNISGQVGKTYKVTLWVKLNTGTTCSTGYWGGFRPRIDNWGGLTDPVYAGNTNIGTIDYLTPDSRILNTWYKETFSFKVNTATSGQLVISAFSGGCTWDVTIDDVQYFEVPTTNTNPTVSIQANNSSFPTIPAVVNFTSNANDIDGVISYYNWDFGDGGHSNLFNPSHTYISNGNYKVTLTVFDDNGGSASSSLNILVNDSSYPKLNITSPTNSSTNSAVTTFSGTSTPGSGNTLTKVDWSTDRGQKGTAIGTNSWSFSLDLTNYSGRNRITINSYDSNGHTARQDFVYVYNPVNTVSVVNGVSGITPNSKTIEEWDKFEATFNIQNSVANNFYFPYETNLPQGMSYISGISVNGIFTSPTGKVYTQPGFIYQDYTKNDTNKNLIPNGSLVWKVRFSPQELGIWNYKISVTDASGTYTASNDTVLNFNVVTPTNKNNHGFIKPSPTDSRYFEFTDGTPFIGVGPGVYAGDPFSVDTDIKKNQYNVATNDIDRTTNFTRTWISGAISGSSWAPWAGGIAYEGNVPGTALTTDEAYGDGIYSLRLDTNQKCAFYGFTSNNSYLKPNTNYKISMRVKTVGVTGTGGLTFRPNTNWPNTCDDFAAQTQIIPDQKGNTDWHVVTANWNSGSATSLGIGIITLENVTAGTAYIDEVSIKEDLGSGQLGAEMLSKGNYNVLNYFSQVNSYNLDYDLNKFEQLGYYQKFVIEEKQDYAFNHVNPYGFGYDKGNLLENRFTNSATLKYQQYYWRYLIARYGYSRAIQSFEYANEQAPADMTMADELQKYLTANDSQRHMGVTSFWCCVEQPTGNFYNKDNLMYYGDSHAYVGTGRTSWLPSDTGALTGLSMVTDSAAYSYEHSMDAQNRNVVGSKPFIMGEAGIVNGSTTIGQNDTDTKGVWLHQFLWGQINPGRINYFLYWWNNNWFTWNDTIGNSVWDTSETVTKDLYPIFVNYRKFMEGSSSDTINKRIPINNGKYSDIQITAPTGINSWGQKDITNGGAYFWAYDKSYNYSSPTGGTALANKTFSFTGMPANTYTAEIWDTWNGTVTMQDLTPASGTVSLSIPASFTQKDVAVKIYPKTTGFPLPVAHDTRGDFNLDLSVNAIDLSILLPHLNSTDPVDLQKYRLRTSPSPTGDTVNVTDLSILLTLLK